jgi:hypothetical protein
MARDVARNEWGIVVHHADRNVLELRWLPVAMTDAAFKTTLALLALEAEKVRPRAILIDATQFRHQFGPGVMDWRDACITPRYAAAGVRRFAFHLPEGAPHVMEKGGTEQYDGSSAVFPTAWFSQRQNALDWLGKM